MDWDEYLARQEVFDQIRELNKPSGWALKKEVEGVKLYGKKIAGETTASLARSMFRKKRMGRKALSRKALS